MSQTMEAARWLQTIRQERRLSLRDLARMSGIAHTTISEAEKGKASFDTWGILADVFEVPREVVLSKAGYLNPLLPKDEQIKEVIKAYTEIKDPRLKAAALKVMRSFKNSE